MAASDGTKYAYMVARVRAMKSKLIPREMYPKFLNMEIPEITRFIGESEYKKDVDELSKKYSGTDLFEHALNQNLALTYRKLIEVSQNEANILITEYLRLWDIWNIKTILRGKFSGASEDEILEDVVSGGQLRYRDLSEIVRIGTLEGVIGAFARTPYYPALEGYKGDLAQIENALDRMYYTNLIKAVSATGNKLFLKFLRTEIDLKNLKMLFRMKRAGMERDDIIKLLIPGGMELKDSDLTRLASMPLNEFVRALEEYSYWNAISDVSGDLTSLVNIEPRLDKYGLVYASRISYYYPLSILPILDYILSKKIEVDNLRIIVRGKETSLPEEIIKAHLVM
ncbi:ATP synthase A1, C subunit [Candidatus Methanoperedens nitroreducens]|uniref:A-type ATP synthase subunit C n=1 Tax=Candidatus Methanoperedens nitratireducens TaxID=1392998 RepID=A0A062V409_9EURY|nr:V-type ATP synthase subunit C [Candidatus Methanoperedens nitroreducens]KCZ71343.1 ATP synthase A1, C subunit [Candidatus Methanoperedens nitroreducens]MDJ1420972.1 V-type ATP synthase subunit C [Candidatus Methanoperedens sp.]